VKGKKSGGKTEWRGNRVEGKQSGGKTGLWKSKVMEGKWPIHTLNGWEVKY